MRYAITTSLLFFTTLLLSGCMVFEVKENNFIKPYKTSDLDKVPISARLNNYHLELKFLENDYVQLYGMELISSDSACVIFYLGGNQFTVDKNGKALVDSLINLKCDIITYDYRGYGRSSGAASAAHLISDAEFLVQKVIEEYPQKEIIVHGHSLGGFITGFVARNNPIDAIVLESTAPSISEWVSAMIPWYAKLFVGVEFEPKLQPLSSMKPIKEIMVPTLIFVGKNDQQAPWQLSKELFESSPAADKWLHVIDDVGHNGIKQSEVFWCGYHKLFTSLDVNVGIGKRKNVC